MTNHTPMTQARKCGPPQGRGWPRGGGRPQQKTRREPARRLSA